MDKERERERERLRETDMEIDIEIPRKTESHSKILRGGGYKEGRVDTV